MVIGRQVAHLGPWRTIYNYNSQCPSAGTVQLLHPNVCTHSHRSHPQRAHALVQLIKRFYYTTSSKYSVLTGYVDRRGGGGGRGGFIPGKYHGSIFAEKHSQHRIMRKARSEMIVAASRHFLVEPVSVYIHWVNCGTSSFCYMDQFWEEVGRPILALTEDCYNTHREGKAGRGPRPAPREGRWSTEPP